VVVVGRPNGAGKSTCAPALLRDLLGIEVFVNADEIARGLTGFAPERSAIEAGRIMLDRIHKLAEKRESFAFETTLASRSFAPFLQRCSDDLGYRTHLIFLWLPSPEHAVARVADRVRRGGHHVEEEVVRRRYRSGLRNLFELYEPLVDTWHVFDNGEDGPATLVAFRIDKKAQIHDHGRWQQILSTRQALPGITDPERL
jgi:predicted ABC-type ATPase